MDITKIIYDTTRELLNLEDGILKNEFERIFNASNWSEKKELKKISK